MKHKITTAWVWDFRNQSVHFELRSWKRRLDHLCAESALFTCGISALSFVKLSTQHSGLRASFANLKLCVHMWPFWFCWLIFAVVRVGRVLNSWSEAYWEVFLFGRRKPPEGERAAWPVKTCRDDFHSSSFMPLAFSKVRFWRFVSLKKRTRARLSVKTRVNPWISWLYKNHINSG